MEPLPYYFDSINRNAIVVKPKEALFNWVNSIYPDSPVSGVDEGIVYLIKEKDSNYQIENWLKRNFDEIFQNELNNWHTDESAWPPKRTYRQFKEWFDVEIHSMIVDMEDDEIIKEEG